MANLSQEELESKLRLFWNNFVMRMKECHVEVTREDERAHNQLCTLIQRKVSRERIIEITNMVDNKMSWELIVKTIAKELGYEVEGE